MTSTARLRVTDLAAATDDSEQSLDDRRARDAETGLYNATFMREMLSRLFKLYDRGNGPGVSVFVFLARFDPAQPVDGASEADLRAWVALALSSDTRGSDIPVHLGGGVMAVFLVGARPDMLQPVAERISQTIRQPRRMALPLAAVPLLHGGLAMRRQRESLEALLGRARAAMDEAEKGRNRILAAVEYFPV